jgi:hypothetical protein
MPFRPIVFSQVNVFARPVLQFMYSVLFPGVESAIGTGFSHGPLYPPLLSDQAL